MAILYLVARFEQEYSIVNQILSEVLPLFCNVIRFLLENK